MNQEEGIHYMYRHIRLDKNEVFYVGIGTKSKRVNKSKLMNVIYSRAYTTRGRNCFWKRIVSKTEWIVEIMIESNNYEFIKEKEIEFISLYGRRDLKLGTLCNLTDGGEGLSGVIVSDSTRKKLSLVLTGKKRSEKTVEKNRLNGKTYYINNNLKQKHFDTFSKTVYQYDSSGHLINEWLYPQEIKQKLGIKISGVFNCLSKRTKSSYGYYWSYEKTFNASKIIPRKDKYLNNINTIIIFNVKTGEEHLIKNRNDALKHFPKSGTSSIYKCLRGELKSVGGYTCRLVN